MASVKFASGKYTRARCDRCGWQYKLKDLKFEYVMGKRTGFKVCPDCHDPDHEQNYLPIEVRRHGADPEVVKDPREDPEGVAYPIVVAQPTIYTGNQLLTLVGVLSGPTTFNDPWVVVNGVYQYSGTRIVANVTLLDSAPIGSQFLTITDRGNRIKIPVNISIYVPPDAGYGTGPLGDVPLDGPDATQVGGGYGYGGLGYNPLGE